MPSASTELQDEMLRRFGARTGEQGPIQFLEKAGYKFTREWNCVVKPGIDKRDDIPQDEWNCYWFLVTEWDFGDMLTAEGKSLP